MKKFFYSIVIVEILFLSFILVITISKEKNNIGLEKKKYYNESKLTNLNLLLKDIPNLEGKKINDNNIYDSVGEIISLRTILEKKGKIVFVFSDQNCHECIETELKRIKENFYNISSSNFIIIKTYAEVREISIIEKQYNLKIPIYVTKDKSMCNISDIGPCYFLLDSTLKIKMPFIPYPNLEHLALEYMKILNSNFYK